MIAAPGVSAKPATASGPTGPLASGRTANLALSVLCRGAISAIQERADGASNDRQDRDRERFPAMDAPVGRLQQIIRAQRCDGIAGTDHRHDLVPLLRRLRSNAPPGLRGRRPDAPPP